MKLGCRFSWHNWDKWKVVEVKCRRMVEVNDQDVWVDTFQRSMHRECLDCGLYQERKA